MRTKNLLAICIFTLLTVDLTYARWPSVDPKAENYYPQSPYAFCNNNPIKYVDLDGREWKSFEDKEIAQQIQTEIASKLALLSKKRNKSKCQN